MLKFIKNIFKTNQKNKIVANEKIDTTKLKNAEKIISQLQNEIQTYTSNGCGPFIAAIYDKNNNLIIKIANSVVNDNCSNHHAEMMAIKKAQEILNTYDLSKHNLKLYITAEPCMMCIGGIMWSGIKEVYYGVSSKDVENITGFDEGFKPNWLNEFKKRGITVYGNILPDLGTQELKKYVQSGKNIYQPSR